MKKWIIVVISITFVIASSIFYYKLQKTAPQSIAQIPQPQEKIGNPIILSIPKFNVTATIESVGLDSKNRMDIPKNFNNVAWYSLGFQPGEKGSAVIDGHVDTPTGAPAVFAQIATLQQGDSITVQDSYNKTHSFTVIKVVTYPYDTLPLQMIFNSTDKPRLNLITCAGKWDRIAKNYSERTVVFAEKE